ncbi:MAG: MBG domain-containing protein [Bacteroidales bacterium]|nr:MBG domain-containing protein [Bacteroidales bacterium]
MSSKSNAELTKRIVGSRLWLVWIWICSGIVCLADLAGIITLAVEGVQGVLYVLPIVFLAIDVVITLLSVFLNFRFRRALAVPIIYAVVKVLIVFAAIGTFFGDYIMFSTAAAVLWLLFEVVSIVCVLVSAVYAKGSGKSFTVVVAVLTAVIVILCGVYTYFVATNGFFGQSRDRTYEKRTLVYSFYDENEDSLTVSGVLDGSGDTVVIPETFNGLPVVGVDCRVFIYEGVDTIVLQCGEGTEFSNVENLCYFDDDVSVYVESDNVNYFRNYFFALAEEVSSSGISTYGASDGYAETLSVNIEGKTPKPLGEALAGFANTMTPVVDDDQIFVSISIDCDYVAAIGGKIPDVWIGEKGESFDFYEVYGFDYLDHMDEESEDDLYWCYENLGRYILLDVVDSDGKSVLGRTIETSSVLSYEMSRVYAVKIGESNDTKHTELDAVTGRVLTSGFYPEGSSSGLGQRYVTENTADKIFGFLDERTGFTLSWKAGEAASYEKDITTFKGNIYDGMTVSPFWTMADPVISEIYTDKEGNEAVYGNSVTFSVDASFADSDILLSYDWEYAGNSQSDESSFTLTNMLPSQSGTYVVTVTAGGDGNTSLTTSTVGSLYLTVNARDVTLTWTTSTDLVYSGTEVEVSVAPNTGTNAGTSGTVNGDNLTFDMVKTGAIKDVGDYTVTVSLSDAWDELYDITNPSKDYTVTAYPLTVVWDKAATFTYTGAEQHPDYSYTGRYGETGMEILGGDTLSTALNVRLSYAGSDVGIDAGEHTATLSTENKNYTLLESSCTYGIAKKSVRVTWVSESSFVYTYNSYDQYPTVETSDLVGGDARTNDRSSSVTLIYSNYGKYAGTYTVSVSVNSDNYELEEGENIYATEYTYTIDQKPVTITWQDTTSFEYDAGNHTIEATINDIESSDLSGVYLSYWSASDYTAFEYGVNAGTYKIYATLSGERAGNYLLNDNSATYTITPKSLTIEAKTLSKTYDSHAYADVDTYSYTELATGDNLEEIVKVGVVYTSGTETYTEARDAREYTVTLAITPVDNAKYENYSITNGLTLTGGITISPAPLTLEWTYPELTYNGGSQQIYASVSGFVGTDAGNSEVTSHVSNLVYTITQSNTSVDPKNAGTYDIKAELNSDVINYYIVNGGDASTSFEIFPYTVELTWGEDVITYRAEELVPTYSYYISDTTLSWEFGTALTSATVSGKIANVGKSTAVIGISDSNFEITNPTCDFEIVPVELTITWKMSESDTSNNEIFTYTYTAAAQGPVAVIDADQVFSSDSGVVALKFTYSGTEFGGSTYSGSYAPTNAGNYSVLAGTTNTNYIVSAEYETRYFVINKATLSVAWDSSGEPFTYNGSSQQIYASVTGVVGSESIGSLLYTVSKGGRVTTSYSDAGEYTIKASLNDSVEATKNYVLDEETAESSFTISPLEITIGWSETTALTYCGREIIPEYGYYYGEIEISGHEMSTIMGVTESGGQRYVGSDYTAEISISNGNYTLKSESGTCSFSIVAKEITITWDVASNGQYTYTAYGISPSATIDSSQIFGDDTVEIVYTYTGVGNSSDKPVNVGTYTVTASSSNENYVVENCTTLTFTIAAATLVVSWDAVTELTYNGGSQQIYASVEPFGSDTLTLVYTITGCGGNSDTEHKNAGTYCISVALESGVTNYVLDGNTTSSSFTVKPLDILVVWGEYELEYNGECRVPSHTYSVPAGSTSETVTDGLLGASVTIQNQSKDVGTYTASLTITNGNYSVSNYQCSFTIVAKEITVTWDTTELTYNGFAQHPTATIDDGQICNGDSVGVGTYTYTDGSSSEHKDVGTYSVEASLDNSNYVIKTGYAEITFTINPKPVTISWTEETFTYDKTGKTPTATIEGGCVVSGDTVDIVYTYDNGSVTAPVDAGSYFATASSGNSNYVLSGDNLTLNFTIDKATLALSWPETLSYEYTGAPIEPEATFAENGGAYDGDDVGLVYTYSEGHTDVGSYFVMASSTNPNYEISSNSATFNYSITAKTVTVTSVSWDRLLFTYNGNAQTPVATVTLSESVEYTIEYTYSASNGTTLGSAPTDAGSYTVTIAITLSSSNYSLDTTAATLYATFGIEKATLTVEWTGGESFTEGDGSAMHPVATVSGWVEGNEVTVTYTYATAGGEDYSETEPTSAGNYTVKIELVYDENNYALAGGNVYEKSYTITAASGGAGV